MSFVDLMIRRNYWIQFDRNILKDEGFAWSTRMHLIEQIANRGGLLIWDVECITVSFHGRSISDADLGVFDEFEFVDDLVLSDTGVTDAGLKHLVNLKRLRHLNVNRTQVTDEAVEQLELFLPDCFVWNGK